MITVIHAHPYPAHSRAVHALLEAIRDLPQLQVRSLYDLYPDFDIDAAAEQRALESARVVVLLHPLYWYAAPALLKLWFEQVLVRGWAYGEGGNALAGKDCLWAVAIGGDTQAFSPVGGDGQSATGLSPAIEHTATFCGMRWLEPFVLHGGRAVPDAELAEAGRRLRALLVERSA